MTDKQVRFEIRADVKGEESIAQLIGRLEDMGKVLDGEVGANARAAAARLRELEQQDGAITAFTRLQTQANDAARALKSAEKEASAYGQQIAAAGPPTAQEAAALQRLQEAAAAAKVSFAQQQQAVAGAQAELQRYGIAGQTAQATQTRLRNEVAQVRDSVKDLGPAYQGAAASAQNAGAGMVRTHRAIGDGVDSISQQLANLQRFYVGLSSLQGLKSMATDVAQTADQVNNLQARLKLVTGEGQNFARAWEGVQDISLRTHSALEETGTLFARLAQSGKDAGLSTADASAQALALTETINQAIQLGGASAEASKAAITQLVQGLQSGALRGDEFNSVMEQAPRLARVLADGIGVTTGELRQMAEAGQLSGETVIKALQGQGQAVAAEFSKLPPTVGRALQDLTTNWSLYIAEVDKASSGSARAAGLINSLSANLKTIADLLIDVGQAGAATLALKTAQYFLGVSSAAQTAATAVAGQTTATVANTAAAQANAAALGTAATAAGRLSAILSGLRTFTLVGLLANFKDIGTAIGEGIAQLAGFKDRTDELARAERTQNEIAKESAAARARLATAIQEAIDKQFELSKAARAALAEFDELTKKGASAAEAVKKITEGFDLSKVQGVKDFGAVLDKLAVDAKLSAAEVQAAWSAALNGKDLAAFEATARAAFTGAVREGERLTQLLDATLREATRRSGQDFDVISGGMSKASRSAINDTEAIIAGLGRLKTAGVDVERVLTASIGKGIDTADSQKAIEAVRQQIEAVRRVLGDKIADGLLDQARAKANELADALDKARPGINSVREAMAELGLKSREDLQRTADKAREAYAVIAAAGQAEGESYEAWHKRKTAAATEMLNRMLAANGGVRDAAIESRAAMEGLELATDRAGKTIVRAMGEGAQGVDGLGHALRQTTEQMRAQEDAMDRIEMRYKLSADYTERQIALLEREAAAIEKAAEAERKRLGIDKEKYSLDASGKRIEQLVVTRASVAQQLQGGGVPAAGAAAIAAQMVDAQGGINMKGSGVYQDGDTLAAVIEKLIKRYGTAADSQGSSAAGPSASAQTYTVNLTINGRATAVNVASAADANALIAALRGAAGNSGLL